MSQVLFHRCGHALWSRAKLAPSPAADSFTPSHTLKRQLEVLTRALAVRTKRVKEARDEAKKEIEDYRKSKEEEFKKYEAQHSQGNQQAEDEANKEADAKIKEIEAEFKKLKKERGTGKHELKRERPTEKIEEAIAKLDEKIKAFKLQMEDREAGKEVALGTRYVCSLGLGDVMGGIG